MISRAKDLPVRKFAAIVAVSEELLQLATAAESLISAELRAATTRGASRLSRCEQAPRILASAVKSAHPNRREPGFALRAESSRP